VEVQDHVFFFLKNTGDLRFIPLRRKMG
jgi:hypothetical protein